MIKFNDVQSQWNDIKDQVNPKIQTFFESGPYILGPAVKQFETDVANRCSTKYAVGVSSGTDGLILAIKALNPRPGTKIIMAANAFIADAYAAVLTEYEIVLVDCDDYFNIDVLKLRDYLSCNDGDFIVLCVHLYGRASNVPYIKTEFPGCMIIEDCSQAFGSTISGVPVGTIGDIGVFSLYPTKNLGACGDAGIVVTNNKIYYDRLLHLREYGSIDKTTYQYVSGNHRLDELQAIILLEKLNFIDEWIKKKQELAQVYNYFLPSCVESPLMSPWSNHTYHLYVILAEQRDELKLFLAGQDIPTMIHYPSPLTKISTVNAEVHSCKNAEYFSKHILSLPMHPYLSDSDVKFICNSIKRFYERSK